MRALHLYNIFGAPTERAWLNYPLRLAAMGHDIHFAAERIDSDAPAVPQTITRLSRVQVDAVAAHDIDAQMRSIAAAAPARDPALAQLLAASFDIVHGHFGPRLLHAAPFLLRSIPVVISLYGYDLARLTKDPAWIARYRWAAEHGARFVVLCEAMRTAAIDLGIPASSIEVIHLGLKLEDWPYQPAPAPAQPRFVFVGRLTAKKGLGTLIEAFDPLFNRFPSTMLDVIGDGELAAEVRVKVNYLGLDEPILLLGAWPMEKVRRRLIGATAFVLPSETAPDGDREGTPVALMEALALGVPCITTHHAGNPEVLPPTPADLRQKFIVPERNPAALSQAMAAMIELPADRRAELQQAGRSHIESHFSVDTVAAQYDQLYRQLTQA
jgi:glycosyltransferase involved in cell wall biosynthesis